MMTTVGGHPPDKKDAANVAATEGNGLITERAVRNHHHDALDSAMHSLGTSRQNHDLYRLIASLLGALLALGLLHASLTGSGDLPKIEEAIGSALLFASITGIAVTLLRWLSRVEQRAIAAHERESRLRRRENELLSMEFDRIREHVG